MKRILTGIEGLDTILKGGFFENFTYLLRGGSGTGKTTIGIQFLLQGIKEKEKVLYITFEEPEEKIKKIAKMRGLELEKIEFLDFSPGADFFAKNEVYSLFTPAEVEKQPLTNAIIEKIEKVKPKRIFIDSITQFKYLAPDIYQYRKMVLSLIRYLSMVQATTLISSEINEEIKDDDLKFVCDGVISLFYYGKKRTISVEKFRGSSFLEGNHILKLSEKGAEVFTRIPYLERKEKISCEKLSSGIDEMDKLLGGGIEKGTITIISGPSGVGKTTLILKFFERAYEEGKNAIFYSFGEEVDFILKRCSSIKMKIEEALKKNKLTLTFIEPLKYSIEEFFQILLEDIKRYNAEIVAIDEISSFELFFEGENLKEKMHSLCKYLQKMNFSVFIANELDTLIGDFKLTEKGISHLADNIIIIKFFEAKGEIKKAIGVIKKRCSDFEKTLREFEITKDGIFVGEPLKNLKGLLIGVAEEVR